jgi:hypothetical protein
MMMNTSDILIIATLILGIIAFLVVIYIGYLIITLILSMKLLVKNVNRTLDEGKTLLGVVERAGKKLAKKILGNKVDKKGG